jgi:Cysteine-rich CPXCG
MARRELASTKATSVEHCAGEKTPLTGFGLDDELDDEFPLGDGTAESSAVVFCPYCGESVELSVDPGGGSLQEYVEDCEVCCNPWNVTVRFIAGVPEVSVERLDT